MRVYIALGSNLGNREEYLRSGLRGLADRHVKISRTAALYSSAPRDVIEQPWFLNTVIEADTQLGPEELLAACLEVERDNNRIRDSRISKGPRTLDIDIIFYGTEILRTPILTIPHPRFAARRFVLIPLAEIAPNFVDPVSGRSISDLLEGCSDEGEVVRAGRL
jgi:2-amino-4-hydroxy-6-hydroxymethyldihydropteridine diphosphokinase